MIVFVEWAKGQIKFFAEMFRKQVFSSDVDDDTVRECLATTRALNKKVCVIFTNEPDKAFSEQNP